MLHRCIANSCIKSLFSPLVQVEPHKSLKFLHCRTLQEIPASLFSVPERAVRVFQEKGSCVLFCIAPHRRLGHQESTVHQGNLPADSLLSKPVSGVQGPGGSLGLVLSSAASVIVHLRGAATTGSQRRGFRQLIQTALTLGNSISYFTRKRKQR